MLWVRQGEVNIPGLDDEFADRLRSILGGIIINEADDEVRKLITEKLKQWFTPGNIKKRAFFNQDLNLTNAEQLILGKVSTGSDLNKQIAQIETDQASLAEIERRLIEFEQDMEEAESNRDELREAERLVKEAEAELRVLQANEGEVEEKKKRADKSKDALVKAEQNMKDMRREREAFEKCALELEECGQIHKRLKTEDEKGQAEYDRIKRERDEIREEMRGLETELEELETGALIESKQRILDLSDEMARKSEKRDHAKSLEDEIADARSRMRAIVIPSDKDDKKIRKLLELVTRLKAELDASQLNFRLLPEKDMAFSLALDHEKKQEVTVRAGEEIRRRAKQRLELVIPGVGEISFGRGEADEALEKQARKFEEAVRELAGLLTPLGIDPTASSTEIIAELESRKVRFDTLQRSLEEKEEKLRKFGDQGSAGLEGEIRRLEAERSNLIGSSEELKNWEPSQSSLADTKRAFEEKRKEFKVRLEDARKRLKNAEEELEHAADRQKKLGDEVTKAATRLKVKEEDMTGRKNRYESLEKMDVLIVARERELEESRHENNLHLLTPEEEKFGERLRDANDLRADRLKRKEQLVAKKAALEERLRGLEGLHSKKIGLEQRLAAAKREQARLETEIKAHAILALVFDRLHSSGIESSLRPVTEQIEPWLRALYGADAKKIVFGSGMQAEKIKTEGGEFPMSKCPDVTSHGELEQLSTLVRLAYGVVLAKEEPQLLILDDPLAHSDPRLLRKFHPVIEDAARKNLQLVILTCNREGFDRISGAQIIDLATDK